MSGKGNSQQETPAQAAMREFAIKQYQDYKVRQLPLQQHLAAVIDANNAPDSEMRRLTAGKAATDTKIAFAKSRTGIESALANNGVSPGSARSNLALTGSGSDEATATGVGNVISNQQADDAYVQGLSMLTALGRGDRANVTQGLAGSAAMSARQAQIDAENSLAERAGTAQLVGQFAGTGLQQAMRGGPPPVQPLNTSTPVAQGDAYWKS
jgi:hypothetical protein